MELLHLRQGRLGLGLRRRHVAFRARRLGLLHEVEGLAGTRLRTGERPRRLHILTTRALDVLTAGGLNVLATRALDVLTTRGLDTLATRALNVLTARALDVLTTRGLDTLTARALNVLTARALDVLPTRGLDALATRALDVLATRGLDVLTTRALDVLTARRLDVLATRRLDLARTRERARRLDGVSLRRPHAQLFLGLRDFGRARRGLGLDGRRGKRGDREGAHQACKHSLHIVPSSWLEVG